MNALGKNLLLAGLVVASIGAGVGGTLGATRLLPHYLALLHEAATSRAASKPKPIYFADLSDVVVSIPPQPGAPATSYVEFGVQFSTYDPNAVANFNNFQPIIKAQVISLLMNETSSELQDPKTRASLIQNCLDISNTVLAENGDAAPTPPFGAAYITNLVIQD